MTSHSDIIIFLYDPFERKQDKIVEFALPKIWPVHLMVTWFVFKRLPVNNSILGKRQEDIFYAFRISQK